MLKKLALVNGPAGCYDGKIGVIVAVCDKQRSRNKAQTRLYKLLVDEQISSWLPSEWLEILEAITQDQAVFKSERYYTEDED